MLIVEDDTLVGMGIKSHVERLGHLVVGQAGTVEEAVGLFRSNKPDLCLVDIRLDAGGDGIDLASRLMKERRCPMIIISAYSDMELIRRATDAGVFGYLVKPVNGESLAAQIEVAVCRFDEQERLSSENAQLAENLATRKLVERAKAILMKRLNLSEPDAHKRLQQESQRRRIGLPEVARKIIESDDLLGGKL
ncbi:MAG: response regulator [Chthoniobacterales bacterium]|nr:response regulator [Chthoniobacterales bacterium]